MPLDGIGINRPYQPVTADTTAAYRNNPNGSTDPTGLTDLTGTATFTYPSVVTTYVTFGTTCAANADAGSCSSNSSGTSGGKNVYYYKNADSSTGSGNSTVYYGVNLKTRNSSSGSYTKVTGDTTTATKNFVTWTVTVTDTSNAPSVSNDNRWKCGYGSSPMDGSSADSDGNIYPNGGPYYYRYKTTAPTITVDAYGNPDSAGRTNLFTAGNWEAVSVPDTTATINGTSVNQWQNFANWYAYYRTRNLMTRTALSRVFGNLGAPTNTGGFGNSLRIAWQNLYTYDDFSLQSSTIISSLLDANSPACDASTVNPTSMLFSGTTTKTAPNCYRSAFFNWIFSVPATGGTPARASAIRAGKFFQRGNGNTGGTGDLHDPYWQPPTVSGADGLELVCRQNYHMLVTDGYWNESDPTLPSPFQTSESAIGVNGGKLPDGTVYSITAPESRVYWDVQGATYTSSQANIAFNYWATNLRPDLYDPTNGKIVPPYMPDTKTGVITGATSPALEKYFNPNNDPANWPHMVEYMVTLGVPGELTFSKDADCVDPENDLCKLRLGQTNSTGAVGWTLPANNSAPGIDDTWHAAVNSRGAYFNAANPQNLVDQLTNILTNISARNVPADHQRVEYQRAGAGRDRLYRRLQFGRLEWRVPGHHGKRRWHRGRAAVGCGRDPHRRHHDCPDQSADPEREGKRGWQLRCGHAVQDVLERSGQLDRQLRQQLRQRADPDQWNSRQHRHFRYRTGARRLPARCAFAGRHDVPDPHEPAGRDHQFAGGLRGFTVQRLSQYLAD